MRLSKALSIPASPDGVDGAQWLLAAETPVALAYNGQSYAVMMATPADLTDFALGFSLFEGIVAAASEVEDMAIDESEAGITHPPSAALQDMACYLEHNCDL